MQKQIILVGVVALLMGGIGGYFVAKGERGSWRHEPDAYTEGIPSDMHRMPDGTMMHNGDIDAQDQNGRGRMMNMMVESEREFITEMIPHHQEAVDTAKEVIARGGTTPEIKNLALQIVAAQEKEIADMKMWYETWYGKPYTAQGTYVPMMRELSLLAGAELDRAFLEDMIMHHMGAIMMAQSVQPHIEHTEVKTLTQAIVTTQTAEITAMREMLKGL